MFLRIMSATLGILVLCSAAHAAEGTFTTHSMTLETATKAAQAALASCREAGYQVTVTVVDRGGNPQVLLRDRFAGPHTPDTAIRKAWTAVSFRSDTESLAKAAASGSLAAGISQITTALILGGGRPIESEGAIVGGIGVSGAPSPTADDVCARHGIEAVVEELTF